MEPSAPVASPEALRSAGLGLFRLEGGNRFWWSPEVYRLFGFDPADGPPAPGAIFDHFHPDDRSLTARQIARCVHTDERVEFLFRTRPSAGDVRHVWSRGWREHDERGGLCVVGVMLDATAMVADQAALLAGERQYRFVSENVRDAIGRYTLDGALTSISRASIRMFGYTPEEMVGTTPALLIHPDDRGAMWRATTALLRDPAHDGEPVEYRMQHRDGRWIWCESRPRLIVDASGAPLEWIDIIRDISDRKATDAALNVALAEAEAAAAVKSEFLANMSHELRTPLTSILGFARLLGDSPKLDGEARRQLDLVQAAGETLLAIVNDVLDFSRLEAGQVQLAAEPFDPGDLLTEAAALMAPTAAGKGLALVVEAPAPVRLAGDPARLRQVLLNLLSNALKFTEQGRVTIGADWDAADDGAVALRLWVEDTGVGVPPGQLDCIFNRFAQADGSAARRFGGAGLGLAITRQLTTLMGGSVTAASDGATGSRFEVALTLAPSFGPVVAVAPAATDTDADRPLRLLLAEDNPSNQALVAALLKALDATLDIVDDGEQAVQAVQAGAPYDLILMDMQMPVVDGPAATRAIRALPGARGGTPILALTANVLPEQVLACATAGMDGHVAKPIVPLVLLQAILDHARPMPGMVEDAA